MNDQAIAIAREVRIGRMVERSRANAENKPHGVRIRYAAGCRCDLCRKANSNYENERQKARRRGDWNGIIDATPVREHIRKLRRQGIGRNMISEASDVPRSVVQAISCGKRPRLRARTASKILAVTTAMRGDAALVSSVRAWRQIDALLEEGYTIGRIATELGYARPYLQFKRGEPMLVRTVARIDRVFRKLTT